MTIDMQHLSDIDCKFSNSNWNRMICTTTIVQMYRDCICTKLDDLLLFHNISNNWSRQTFNFTRWLSVSPWKLTVNFNSLEYRLTETWHFNWILPSSFLRNTSSGGNTVVSVNWIFWSHFPAHKLTENYLKQILTQVDWNKFRNHSTPVI